MKIVTIDPYYNIGFYNECKQALNNNEVEFTEYVSSKPPFNFYLEVENEPAFIDYDLVTNSYSRFLVNIVKPVKPNDEYIYTRRDSITNTKALSHYCVNAPLRSAEISGEGIFFTANKEEILRISKDFPRKIWFMGRYFNRKYRIFFTDNLLVKNFISSDQVLVESRNVKRSTDMELELNYNIFKGKDRLEKLSETPYLKNGKFYPVNIKSEISDKYTLA